MTKDPFYSRLKKYYKDKLKNFHKSTVAVLGCGGVGSFAAEFLARSGINLKLVDYDKVDISNLSRQNYTKKDIGLYKVDALEKRIKSINEIKIEKYKEIFSEKNAKEILKDVDFVLIAFDNNKSSKIAARVCRELKKPFVNASAIKQQGEIWFAYKKSLFEKLDLAEGETNDNVGVDSIVPAIVGLISTEIIINYLAFGKTYDGLLFRFDFKDFNFETYKF